MMRKFLLSIAMVLSSLVVSAQDIDFGMYKNININNIPETQIKTASEKLIKRGESLESIVAQARSRGLSERQINQLKNRFAKYMGGSGKDGKDKGLGSKSKVGNNKSLSTKQKVNIGPGEQRIFGHDIFNKENLTFEPAESMAVPDSYIIGLGDEIDIDIYGAADMSYELEVGTDGTVNVPMVGPVKVAGLKLEEARARLTSKMRTIYSDLGGRTKAAIRVGALKPVTVSVIGEAYMPGTFTVSSASSVFHVLYLSGGPNANGSYRDIQLIRNGSIIAHLDVYDYLLNGKADGNVGLADGDIVMIPTYQKRVAVGGYFKRTGQFEAKEGETVADLIRYAGGYSSLAMEGHTGLFRVGKYAMEFKEVSRPDEVKLANGDSLYVSAVDIARMDGMVSIEGAVFAPGYYEYAEGMKLSALIEKAGGLKENAFQTHGVISRRKDDFTLESVSFVVSDINKGSDIELKSRDEVTIGYIDDMREAPTVSISGEVNSPTTVDYRENLTVGDLIVLASGLTEKASLTNVEIVRRLVGEEAAKSPSTSKKINTVTITRDLTIGDSGNDFKLEPFDEVFIRTLPSALIGGSVTLSGAFLNPGGYGLTSNTTRLSDIVKRCGGFTSTADISGARLLRRIVVSEKEKNIKLRQMAEKQDTVFYLKDEEIPYEIVAIDLQSALNNPGTGADLYLVNGDELVVPELSRTVRISGSVQSVVSIQWKEKWNAKDYVKAAGGFAARAHKKKTYVVYPNGQSASVDHILFFRRYPKVVPGTEVIVPQKPESDISSQNYIQMGATVTSALSTAAVVIVTLLNNRNNK